jgi:hypothetical protein
VPPFDSCDEGAFLLVPRAVASPKVLDVLLLAAAVWPVVVPSTTNHQRWLYQWMPFQTWTMPLPFVSNPTMMKQIHCHVRVHDLRHPLSGNDADLILEADERAECVCQEDVAADVDAAHAAQVDAADNWIEHLFRPIEIARYSIAACL